jgi:hypothetical protein
LKNDQKLLIKGIVSLRVDLAVYNENGIILYDSEGIKKELTKLSKEKKYNFIDTKSLIYIRDYDYLIAVT